MHRRRFASPRLPPDVIQGARSSVSCRCAVAGPLQAPDLQNSRTAPLASPGCRELFNRISVLVSNLEAYTAPPALSTSIILYWVRRINASLRRFVRRLLKIGGKQTIFYKPIQSARPGFICISAHIGTHGPYNVAARNIAYIKTNVQYEIGDLLHRAGDSEAGADLFGEIGVAATAGLKIAAAGAFLDRGYVSNLVPAGVQLAPCATARLAFADAFSRHRWFRRSSRPSWCR